MAKKELLFFIVVLTLVYAIFNIAMSLKADAADIPVQSVSSTNPNIIDITEESAAREFAQTIANVGRRSAISSIKDKWNELQLMMQGTQAQSQESQAVQEVETSSLDSSNTTLKVFVSTSMSVSLLASYGLMAKKYGAVLVLKGLPEGSWRKLSDLVFALNKTEGDNITVQIDDPAFDEYGITRVPSFILVREENVFEDNKDKVAVFDKITGNIGIKRALEEFAEKGELQTDAKAILNKVEGQ